MIRKNFKFILIFFILFNVPSFSLSIEPDIFVQSTVNRASQTLSKNISKEEKMILNILKTRTTMCQEEQME